MKSNKKLILTGLLILAIGFLLGRILAPSGHQIIKTSNHQTIEPSINQIWTCAMHPQIRSSEPGQCPICGMELIPLGRNGHEEHESPFVHTMTAEAVALANIQTAKVQLAEPSHRIRLTGKVNINEQKISALAANFSGRIDRLYVNVTGQQVNAGQRIASIYSPELVTAQKELLEAAKTREINSLLYEAAKEKLRLWKITEKQIEDIEKRGEVKTQFEMYAGVSGVVLDRNVSEGDFVSRGEVLLNIADLSSVWILLDAYETDLPLIRKGDKVEFTVSSIPGRTFTAIVEFIDPVINPQTRTASLRLVISNKDLSLKPEMFVNAVVQASTIKRERVLVVPATAVLWTGKRSVVYVKLPEMEMPSYEMREISIGPRLGDFYEVESGLETGEEVVVNGAFVIDAASQLNGGYSMMNRPENLFAAVPGVFREQLNTLTLKYFDLKNALVASDFKKAAVAATGFKSYLSAMEMKQISGEVHKLWMEEEAKMRKAISAIVSAKDLSGKRKNFSALSDALIKIIRNFRYNYETVHIAYCPMAVNNEGAYWLSEFEEIRNPYFGEAMLTCGEVKEMLMPFDQVDRKSPAPEHVH